MLVTAPLVPCVTASTTRPSPSASPSLASTSMMRDPSSATVAPSSLAVGSVLASVVADMIEDQAVSLPLPSRALT